MPRKRRGCSTCRRRHLKCDLKVPKCTACAASRKTTECVYNELHVRQSIWQSVVPGTDAPLSPVDSNQPSSPHAAPEIIGADADVNAEAEAASNVDIGPDESFSPSAFAEANTSTSTSLNIVSCSPPGLISPAHARVSGHEARDLHSSTEDLFRSRKSPATLATTLPFDSWRQGFGGSLPEAISEPPREPLSDTISCEPSGVLCEDENEFAIFRFYKDVAGVLLDIVTPARHLSQTVPRLAVSDSLVYYACLTCSSTILALKGEVSPLLTDHYQDKVISILLDYLAKYPNPEEVDSILASIVILRMSEQFSELNEDERRHLAGAFSLFTLRGEKRKWSAFQTELGGVAFWIYLQQTIRLCFLNGEICPFDLGLVDEDYTYDQAPDEVWANRTTYLLVQACTLCFGSVENQAEHQGLAERLQCQLDLWETKVPVSFKPWAYRDRQCGPFPGIHFLSTWHEFAWQHYYTIRVILGVYKLRNDDKRNLSQLNHYIRSHILAPAQKLCGICFSSSVPGAQINGTHLMSWCAQHFTGLEEQTYIIQWLHHALEETRWPNKTCIQRLKRIWSGEQTDWIDTKT